MGGFYMFRLQGKTRCRGKGGQLSSLFPACSSFGCKCSFNSALNCEKMAPYIHRTFGNEVQLLTNPRLKKVV